MLLLPEERRKGLALEHQAQAEPLHCVLATADARPHAEIIDELQQLKVLAVANHWAEHLVHEAALDTVPLTGGVLVRVIVQDSSVTALALEPSDIRGSLQGLRHLAAPIERWQSTFDAHLLQKLQGPATLERIGIRMLPEKFVVLLDEVPVAALPLFQALLLHEAATGPPDLLTLAPRADLTATARWSTKKSYYFRGFPIAT